MSIKKYFILRIYILLKDKIILLLIVIYSFNHL